VSVVAVVVVDAATTTTGGTAVVGNAYLFLPLTFVDIGSTNSRNRRYVCFPFLQ